MGPEGPQACLLKVQYTWLVLILVPRQHVDGANYDQRSGAANQGVFPAGGLSC